MTTPSQKVTSTRKENMKNKITDNIGKHTQIIQFTTGRKKTIQSVVRIDEGEMLCLTTESGHEFFIPKDKVEWVERYLDDGKKKVLKKKTKKTVKSSWY